MTNEPITFYCYRPALVTMLQEAGYKPRITVSPWNEKRHAWVFEKLDKRGAKIVDEYYTRIGEDVPRIIRGALQ